MPITFVKVNQGLLKEQKEKIKLDITKVLKDSMNMSESEVMIAFEEYTHENSFGNIIFVIVHTIKGKTAEQKRHAAKGICKAVADTAGMDISALRVGFIEYPKESYAIAGVLLSDR